MTGLTTRFLKESARGIWLAAPMLLSIAVFIAFLGYSVGRTERWSKFESFYWAFITATTVGYGDIHPRSRLSRLLAIVVALFGLMWTGILIAVVVRAATIALTSP